MFKTEIGTGTGFNIKKYIREETLGGYLGIWLSFMFSGIHAANAGVRIEGSFLKGSHGGTSMEWDCLRELVSRCRFLYPGWLLRMKRRCR